MKNSQITEIKNTVFRSDTELKIRFKRKNMFRKKILPFPAHWTPVLIFIGLFATTNNITSFVVPLSVKGLLVYRRLEKLYTEVSSVIDLSDKFVDWKCLKDG